MASAYKAKAQQYHFSHYKHEVEHNPYFQYEVDFFKSIRSVFFDSKYKEFKLNSRKNESL